MRKMGCQAGIPGDGQKERSRLEMQFVRFCVGLIACGLLQNKVLHFYKTAFLPLKIWVVWVLLHHWGSEPPCFFLSRLKEAGDLVLGGVRSNWCLLLSTRHFR